MKKLAKCPRHAEQGGKMHQQLSVGAQHVDKADISRLERIALLAA